MAKKNTRVKKSSPHPSPEVLICGTTDCERQAPLPVTTPWFIVPAGKGRTDGPMQLFYLSDFPGIASDDAGCRFCGTNPRDPGSGVLRLHPAAIGRTFLHDGMA